MNLLQRITGKSNTSVPTFTEPQTDVVLFEDTNPSETEDTDLKYECINPTNEAIMKNVPQNSLDISVLDMSIRLYGYWLKFTYFLGEAWDGAKYAWQYRSEIKTAKELAKDHKARQKLFIKKQVQAMIPSIVNFNYGNSCWAEGNVGGNVYRIRNNHNVISNRNIARHWATNTPQVVS